MPEGPEKNPNTMKDLLDKPSKIFPYYFRLNQDLASILIPVS